MEEKLIERGYKRYNANAMDLVCHPFIECFYQKKIEDTTGIKYVIQFYKYPPVGNVKPQASWLCEVTLSNPHATFQMHYVTNIVDCEEMVDKLWVMVNGEYFEKYE